MRIERIENTITFKSGYPTFGTGHLSKKEPSQEIYAEIWRGYKPVDNKEGILKVNYLA